MDFKFPFVLLVIGFLVAGITPFAMSGSLVEPSMEIDMLSGQTQNPFRIQDENDSDIFCVRPDGGFCTEADLPYDKKLHYSTESFTFTGLNADLPTDTSTDNINILAQWHINNGTDTEWDSSFLHAVLDHTGSRDAGTGTCNIRMEEFQLDATPAWASTSLSGSWAGTTYQHFYDDQIHGLTENTDYRLVAYTTNVDTTCTTTNLNMSTDFYVSPHHILTRTK